MDEGDESIDEDDVDWYYVDRQGQQKGPVLIGQFKQAWKLKQMLPTSYIWNELMDEWGPIEKLPQNIKDQFMDPEPKVYVPKNNIKKEKKEEKQENQSKEDILPVIEEKKIIVPIHDYHGPWSLLVTPDGIPYFVNNQTHEMSWDDPKEEQTHPGEWFWVPDKIEAYVPAKKLDTYFDGRIEIELENGDTRFVEPDCEMIPVVWSSTRRIVWDLVTLDDMSPPLILHNLKQRFKANGIYTNIGTILISVNPYKTLPLYTPSVIDNYRHRMGRNLEPHVFTIAGDAFLELTETKAGQSIIISGESGAGKTEATKQCLQYLAEVAGSEFNTEQKILMANPILESFGNAKTVRNNNSSRFGKYVEIFFNSRFSICGATNTNYLLEKVRVVRHDAGERNYHIFYQICAGFDQEQREKYFISDATNYFYCNQSGNVHIDGIEDKEEYNQMKIAMTQLDFGKEQDSIWQIAASLLHLGNIEMKSVGEKKCEVIPGEALDHAAQLFEVTKDQLEKSLITRQVSMGARETIEVSLSVEEAILGRDALAKFVYAKLFDWLVVRVNELIGIDEDQSNLCTIGVLDIFGFEIFKVNSFEQLCINFTNEKLQQFFNQTTFKQEESVYIKEEIKFTPVPYIDNQLVVDLIEKKPHGIIHVIAEELRMPKGSDKTLVNKLHQKVKNSKYGMVRKNPLAFKIEHYAGTVKYDSTGFLVKNRDKLQDDLYNMCQESKHAFFKSILSLKNRKKEKPNKKESPRKRVDCLGIKFKGQLDKLMSALKTTSPHYIRCVKPNAQKKPNIFNSSLVLEQLRYSGAFEAVEIRKKGFPFRFTHENFFKRFKCINPREQWKKNPKDNLSKLLEQMQIPVEEVQIGRTMILYRANQHKKMELYRNLAIDEKVRFLQRVIRGWIVRKIARHLTEVKPILTAAIEKRDLDDLVKALEISDGLEFPLLQWTQAKELKPLLIEEKRIKKKMEELLPQDPEEVADDLIRICADAVAINYIKINPDLVKRTESRRAEIDVRKETRKKLIEGTKLANEEMINWALEKAKDFPEFLKHTAEELKKAQSMKQRIFGENKIISELKEQLSKGGFLKEGDVVDFENLVAVSEQAKSFLMKTKEGIQLEKEANYIIEIRKTFKVAYGTKDLQLWKLVENAVVSAESIPSNAEVNAVRIEISHYHTREDLAKQLQDAVTNRNQHVLEYALAQSKEFDMDDEKYPILSQSKDMLSRIIQARDKIHKACDPVEKKALQDAVDFCEKLEYETKEVKMCRELRDNVIQLGIEAEYGLKMLEEEPMKDIIERADAIKLKIPDIEEMRKLIFQTKKEKFIGLQLKVAIKLGDHARATRVTIRLKELVFSISGDMFTFKNFPKLRSPKGWANMKKVSLKKEKLAAGMLKWSANPIHVALTEVDVTQNHDKQARKMFKNLMGIMGDRQYQDPHVLANEIIQKGLDNVWFRDELYSQIVKQLTQNPNNYPKSMERGWMILELSLYTFPPSTEMENYLEMWTKSNSQIEEKLQQEILNTLHAAVYGGEKKEAPSAEIIQRIIKGEKTIKESLQKLDFSKKREYKVPRAKIRPPKIGGRGTISEGISPTLVHASNKDSILEY